MKEWNTPTISAMTLADTKNVDRSGTSYDNTWAQDPEGQWYLLAES